MGAFVELVYMEKIEHADLKSGVGIEYGITGDFEFVAELDEFMHIRLINGNRYFGKLVAIADGTFQLQVKDTVMKFRYSDVVDVYSKDRSCSIMGLAVCHCMHMNHFLCEDDDSIIVSCNLHGEDNYLHCCVFL